MSGATASRHAWGAGAQVAPQNWRRSGPPPAPQGTCTFVLFDDKAGSGVSLGTVAVWPPTQWPQLDKEAGVCMLQLSQSIPAGSYSVRARPSPPPSPWTLPTSGVLGCLRARTAACAHGATPPNPDRNVRGMATGAGASGVRVHQRLQQRPRGAARLRGQPPVRAAHPGEARRPGAIPDRLSCTRAARGIGLGYYDPIRPGRLITCRPPSWTGCMRACSAGTQATRPQPRRIVAGRTNLRRPRGALCTRAQV